MEKWQRERERERLRRGEKAGTGATCRSCRPAGDGLGKHSGDRCNDSGGGLVTALFREELASLSLKRNTIKNVFLCPRRPLAPAPRMHRHGHFIFHQLTHLYSRLHSSCLLSPRFYTFSTLPFIQHPTFAMFSCLFSQTNAPGNPWKNGLTSRMGVCQEINYVIKKIFFKTFITSS